MKDTLNAAVIVAAIFLLIAGCRSECLAKSIAGGSTEGRDNGGNLKRRSYCPQRGSRYQARPARKKLDSQSIGRSGGSAPKSPLCESRPPRWVRYPTDSNLKLADQLGRTLPHSQLLKPSISHDRQGRLKTGRWNAYGVEE